MTHELHRKAMELAERAVVCRMRGNQEDFSRFSEEALSYELKAIEALTDVVEPTYSVLHRSAAVLALDCGLYRQAEQLAAAALARDPPSMIAEQLRELIQRANFDRHLALNGVSLGQDELQLSLSGDAVGLGIASLEEYVLRVEGTSQLIQRFLERKSGRAFRERGQLPNSSVEEYHPFVSTSRAASFAVTLRIGKPTEQYAFQGISDTAEVIDEVVECIHLLNQSDDNSIQEMIPDSAYLRNFYGIARKIAPDGKRIQQVGFTSFRLGRERSVGLTRRASDIDFSEYLEESSNHSVESVEVEGRLCYADARKINSNIVRVIDDNRKAHDVRIPEGMMNDIVRPLWDCIVIVKGTKRIENGKDVIHMSEITRTIDSQANTGTA